MVFLFEDAKLEPDKKYYHYFIIMTDLKNCRICGSENLTNVLDLGDQVLASRFPLRDDPDPLAAPLVLCKCEGECGLIQLRHTVAASEMYTDNYGYRSGLNEMMRAHLKMIVDDLYSYSVPTSGDVALDIGSNDGTLLSYHSPDITRIGIDPTGEQFRQYYEPGIRLEPDFFTCESYNRVTDQKAKYVTSISMFYDLPRPLEFMKDVARVLASDGIWIMEQSYLPTMIERTSYDTVCHEHLEYYAFAQIEWMCARANLRVLDVKLNDCNGGSFRVIIGHADSAYASNTEAIDAIKMHDSVNFDNFVKACEDHRTKLVELLRSLKAKGKTISLYGASTKGNTLLQYCNIGTDLIDNAAERNPLKYGCRTPKTNIPIVSESEVRALNPDYLLVLPWHFREGIVKREAEYIARGGKLIFPLPCVQII